MADYIAHFFGKCDFFSLIGNGMIVWSILSLRENNSYFDKILHTSH